jgi:CDP-diacylglycerol--glycerol-3-phosphate 3-phosphatidyltransferase
MTNQKFWNLMKNKGFWNLPNFLTVLRIALVPVMVVLLLNENMTFDDCKIAVTIFVFAMITDIIDGWLARKWGLVSPVGAYLDPLADKLMTITVLVMLIPLGRAPAWLVAILLCREVAITGLRSIASQEGLILAASSLGKLKTVYLGTAIGFLLWHYETLGCDAHSAGIVLLWIATFFSVLSGLHYFREFVRNTKLIA